MRPASLETHRRVGGRMRRKDRCNQCNGPLPAGYEHSNCEGCLERARLRGKDPEAFRATRVPRAALVGLPERLSFKWIQSSKDPKLGGIPATISAPSTCPPSCAFYGNGCYGESGFLVKHWKSAALDGVGPSQLFGLVRGLEPGQLWRYAIVGDLPGKGNTLHVGLFRQLVEANEWAGARGFAFTHKPLRRADERRAIAESNRRGFTVNLSANNLAHADQLADLGIAPVAVALPIGAPERQRTPAGRYVIACPEMTAAKLDCARCGLCAIPKRKAIIGFYAHGGSAAAVSEVASSKRLPVIR